MKRTGEVVLQSNLPFMVVVKTVERSHILNIAKRFAGP